MIAGGEHMIYKPGIEFVKAGKLYYLEQNPDTGSFFAAKAREGAKINWELSSVPVAGKKLAYTGKVLLNGRLMEKENARDILTKV